MRRDTWDELFHFKPHMLQFLASHQVSSIVYTGAGKVGSEHGRPEVEYQLSQRADFFETLRGQQTTYRRPIVNSRDEALCGSGLAESERALARLHVIFYDSTLCHVSTVLKVGVLQIVLAMIEAGRVSPELLVEHPLRAVGLWSRDPTLHHAEPMVSGKRWTAVELQCALCENARAFVDDGRCDAAVPHARAILDLWAETLDQLKRRDFDTLAGSLDWVLKRYVIEQAIDSRGEGWDSPMARHLDQQYANLDPACGVYRSMERQGIVRRLVSDEQIERFTSEPPEDTRAWARAMILRSIDPADIYSVDWDRITYAGRSDSGWPETKSVLLDDPRRYGRRELRSRQSESPERGARQRAAEPLALDTEA
jgi:proteasome accessory factor A